MANEIKIDELKAQIKKAKQDNKPYNEVAKLEAELVEERNKDTLKGVFLNMRKETAKIFYHQEKKTDAEVKKDLIECMKKYQASFQKVEVQ